MTGSILAFIAGLPLTCVTLSPASMAEPQCHANAHYHVAGLPYPDDAGNIFAVTRLKDGPAPMDCTFDESKADLIIGKTGDSLWFAGLAGNMLILNRSTGPQGDLVVYDIETGALVLDVPSDEYEVKGHILSFWQRTVEASAETCPRFAANLKNGSGAMTAVLSTLNLETWAVTETGESKCIAVQ